MSSNNNDLRINRLNKKCASFPCHEGLEDCTFCFCPFYPCRDNRLGKYVFSKKLNREVWSCKECSWIHQRKVVEELFSLIRGNRPKPRVKSHQSKARSRKPKAEKTGIIILGHGSKLKKANNILGEVVKIAKRKERLNRVEPAYLQFGQPDLSKSIKKMAEKGCQRVVIVPFFLFMGNHVSRDIPKAIEKEAKIYKEIDFVYAKNLGQDSRINEIVLDRIREALSQ